MFFEEKLFFKGITHQKNNKYSEKTNYDKKFLYNEYIKGMGGRELSFLDNLRNLFSGQREEKKEAQEHGQIRVQEEKVEGLPMTQEEKKVVAIISSVIAANDRPDSEFKVRSIIRTK